MAVPNQKDDIACLMEEVEKVETVPPHTKQMVISGLPKACAPCLGAERHKYQTQFASIAQDMIAKATAAVSEEKVTVAETMTKEKTALDTLQESAGKATEAKTAAESVVAEKRTAEKEAKKNISETESGHKRAQKAHDSVKRKRAKIEKEVSSAKAVSEGTFPKMTEGPWDGDEKSKKEAIKAIKELLDDSAEPAVVTAVVQALKMKSEERGDFDKTTLGFGAEALKKKVAAMEQTLTEGADELQELWAEALGLWAAAEVVKGKVEHARKEHNTAKEALEATSNECDAIQEQVTEQCKKLSSASKEHDLICRRESGLTAASTALARLLADDYPKEKEGEAESGEGATAPAPGEAIEGAVATA
jgi:hypothetical protein